MLAARVAEPVGAAVGEALLLHGVPERHYMWRDLLPAVADAGWAVAPDLPGFGASPVDPPTTWERQVEAVEAGTGARPASTTSPLDRARLGRADRAALGLRPPRRR